MSAAAGARAPAPGEDVPVPAARSRPSARARSWLLPAGAVALGAALLRLLTGVGFVNYDTLYALVWGAQAARGETPAYGVPIAPTPHPLFEGLGVVLSPTGPAATRTITVVIAFLALAGCGWVVYALGSRWFGRWAGAIAALILLTRVPILSYGVRAYVDVPYILAVLSALLVESRRPRAGAPVLALLAVAGLLRPEAWAFSALYWLYLAELIPGLRDPARRPPPARLARLALLAALAPVLWLLSDLIVTGDAMWSLTNTRHTASTLNRVTGAANVPEYIPRRIGEILRVPGLAAAAVGGVLSLLWLRRRALTGAAAGVAAVVVFAAFASVGLPINSRYAFLAAAILSIFAGVGICGWMLLPRGEHRRTVWMGVAAALVLGMLAYIPAQYHLAHKELGNLSRQEHIEGELVALVRPGAIALRCGPVGVPNHAPVPLLALYLRASPALVVSLQTGSITRGVYADPRTGEVERDYVLDPRDPHEAVTVPPGFRPVAGNPSWIVYRRCG